MFKYVLSMICVYALYIITAMSVTTDQLCLTNCESVNNVHMNFPDDSVIDNLKEKDWIVVKYTDGRYYYHNMITRQDQWEYPLDTHDEI